MKKTTIIISSLIILAGVIFYSCTKEESKKEIQQINKKTSNSTELRIYYDDGKNYGCKDKGGNCLPDVEIKAPKIHWFWWQLFWKHTLNPQNGKSNSQSLLDFLKVDENKTIFIEYFSNSIYEKVMNNTYIVNSRGEFKENETSYVLFVLNDSNTVDIVYPFFFESEN